MRYPTSYSLCVLFFALVWQLTGIYATLHAQDTLYLQNPSFEDTAHYSRVPEGWLNGGFPDETPPDIAPSGFFRETTQANHGETYLAMVTRDGGTWERIGNQLPSPMEAKSCYAWTIDLARSPIYFSISRVTGKTINFNTPVVLRIWGGDRAEEPRELLAVSPPIEHEDWRRYAFQLEPQQTHTVLILEVMYRLDATAFYAGNLLLDNAGDLIQQTDCGPIDSMTLDAWLPPFPDFSKQAAQAASPTLLDTQQVRTQLDNIAIGRIDIGLYELGILAQKTKAHQLMITVIENQSTPSNLTVKSLRKRLKSMGLTGELKIKKHHVGSNYGTLVAQRHSGEISVWISER